MQYLSEKLSKNQITKNLNDLLYKNERSYVDQSGNKLTNEDQIKLTNNLENQSRILEKRISGSKGGEGLSNFLNRNKLEASNNNPTFKLIPLDVQIAQINAKFLAAETTDPQIASISAIQKKNLEDLLAQYNKIKAQGASIQINIIPKFYTSLNSFAIDVFKIVYRLIKSKKDIVKEESEKFPLPGIWSIINLVVDDSVADRRIVDQSIGNEHGSLLNGIRKICQDPFVEFFSDTYGDKFYLIARKKPFDKQSIVSALKGQSSVEKDELNIKLDKKNKSDTTKDISSNLIIDIEEIDVISDNLTFSQETYSWYRLQLQNLIGGADNSMAFAYLKAVYFKEYADIFGSKPLDVTTNYIPYNPIVDKKNSLSAAYFIKQGTYDLKYMIESHAHLPFTRQGTITMNGDRRIKRGTFVRYKGTGEIYYIEGVANSFNIDMGSIDRATTLQVSRGMIEKHIDPKPSLDGQTYSYFNIINLPIDPNVFKNADSGYSNFNQTVTSKWQVNIDVFNFFIKRLQFLDEEKYKNEFLEKFPIINQNISPSKLNKNDGNNETFRTQA